MLTKTAPTFVDWHGESLEEWEPHNINPRSENGETDTTLGERHFRDDFFFNNKTHDQQRAFGALWILRGECEPLLTERGREEQPRGGSGGHRRVRQGCRSTEASSNPEAQSDSEKTAQVWPHEYQEPYNDQEEQWDDVMPESAPKSTTQF